MADNRQHVVIIGGGFGGLEAAKALDGPDVDITLIDRVNHHLFQPLLYQVATAGLSSPAISAPIRHILRSQKNVTVILGEVTGIDVERRTVSTATTRSSSPPAPATATSATTTGRALRRA